MLNDSIMIDIETLDTTSKSIVLSIGGCFFNGETLTTESELRLPENSFYYELDINSQEKLNRTISISTLKWWSTQSNQLNNWLKREYTNLNNVGYILTKISSTIISNNIKYVWSNGPSFDMVILKSLSEDFDIVFPVDFRKCYDMRTIILVRKLLKLEKIKFIGQRHNSLDDAINQAILVNDTLVKLSTLNSTNTIEDSKSEYNYLGDIHTF